MASINPGKTELEQYFDVIPSNLNIASHTFDKSKTKLKEGYSYVPSQSNPTPVYSFNQTTQINKPKDGQKAEYDTHHIYKMDTPAPAAPAPEPEPIPEPDPEPTGISDKLTSANQYLQDYTRSGKNFESNTLSDRQAKTDSFKQKPAYDPNAGVSSPEAGNFLDDYKFDLKNTISQMRN
jgi:hypothetical protein